MKFGLQDRRIGNFIELFLVTLTNSQHSSMNIHYVWCAAILNKWSLSFTRRFGRLAYCARYSFSLQDIISEVNIGLI